MMEGSDPRVYDLTRRKVLGGLTTVGLASAGAGIGTSAYFSDEETFKNNRLVAGELDLLVAFQEHYSDWSADEAEAVDDVVMPDSGTLNINDYPTSYTGLPVANNAQIAVPTADLDAFMAVTAIDAFPDTDENGTADDAVQDEIPTGNECGYLQRAGFLLDDKGAWISALDSPARTETHRGDPLVKLTDVKPGDFGEITFSIHLCDNPGYVWLTGELTANDEVSVTEPEADSDAEDQSTDADSAIDGELAQTMQAAVWYDTGANGTFFETDDPTTDRADVGEGDNVRQDFKNGEPIVVTGNLDAVLSVLSRGHGLPLDAYPETTSLDSGGKPSGPEADPPALKTISGDAETSSALDCVTVGGNPHCEDFDLFGALKLDEGEDLKTGEYSTPAGAVAVHSFDVTAGTVTLSTNFGVSGVITKGGPVARVCLADGDGDGSSFEETDAVALDEVTFHTPTNPNNSQPYGLSHFQVCYQPGDGEDPPSPPPSTDSRECFPASETASIGFAWWLPIDIGNQIQSDAIAFDLGFYAEQCRHNDGSGLAPEGSK